MRLTLHLLLLVLDSDERNDNTDNAITAEHYTYQLYNIYFHLYNYLFGG
jgi:hypothetical protein